MTPALNNLHLFIKKKSKGENSGVLVFAIGVLSFDVREERSLVQEDLGAVDALQVRSVGQLGVSGEDVFLQLVRLAEGLLAVIAHIQVLLQVSVSSCSLLPAVPLAPQGQVLSVFAVSLPRRREGQGRDSKMQCGGGGVKIKKSRFEAFTCMWLCSDEVEEKPRLHTLHLNGLLELQMKIRCFKI